MSAANPASRRRGMAVALVVAVTVMSMALGTRQTLGLFVEPFLTERGVPVSVFALSVALHNLVWGLAQPITGALSDRVGAGRVIAIGAIVYGLGFILPALVPTGTAAILGIGVLTGLGVSCTAFGTVLSALGRAVPADGRSMAFGIASAGGSLGQVGLLPVTDWAMSGGGVALALGVLAASMLVVAPIGLLLERRAPSAAATVEVAVPRGLGAVLAEARRHRGFVLLTFGFFSCGFQLAFIVTHLPGYLTLCHMPAGLGTAALATIGLFNILGSYACGWLGQRFRPQMCLGWIYVVRGLAIVGFFYAPKSPTVVILFAVVMGVLWLGTVPLTSGLIARMFGVANMGTLFGVVFLSHQVGSFMGAWLGGVVFDLTGAYDAVWLLTATAGLLAALLHFPIKEAARPLPATA